MRYFKNEGIFMSNNLVLRIGDYIALRHSKPNDGWLCSEGILGNDCYTTKTTEFGFDDCLWEVHIQYLYSAMREYEDALFQYFSQNPDERSNEISREYLYQLKHNTINERNLNEKLMKTKIGKPVLFGDKIQLRHLKSGKFMTVNSNKLAKVEKENLRVTIESWGNSLSCLGFIPKFKYDQSGQPVYNGVETLLQVHERSGEYIHTATKLGLRKSKFNSEVNCSLESSCWSISIYQQAKDLRSGAILAGMLISIQDPDSSGFLTINNQQGDTNPTKVIMSPQFQLSSHATSDSYVGTNLLWQIEKESPTEGGCIRMGEDAVTLRDLNSGLFMYEQDDGSVVTVNNRREASLFYLTNSQTSNSQFLHENSTFHICSEDRFLIQIKTRNKPYLCQMVEDQSEALILVTSATLQRTVGSDLFVGVQATTCLRRLESLSMQVQQARNPNTMLAVASNLKHVSVLLQNLSSFLANQSSSLDDRVNTGNDQSLSAKNDQQIEGDEQTGDLVNLLEPISKEMIERRQVMMREQGLLELLLSLLKMTRNNIFDEVNYSNHRPSSSFRRKSSLSTNIPGKILARNRLSVIKLEASSSFQAKLLNSSSESSEKLISTIITQPMKNEGGGMFEMVKGFVNFFHDNASSNQLDTRKGQERKYSISNNNGGMVRAKSGQLSGSEEKSDDDDEDDDWEDDGEDQLIEDRDGLKEEDEVAIEFKSSKKLYEFGALKEEEDEEEGEKMIKQDEDGKQMVVEEEEISSQRKNNQEKKSKYELLNLKPGKKPKTSSLFSMNKKNNILKKVENTMRRGTALVTALFGGETMDKRATQNLSLNSGSRRMTRSESLAVKNDYSVMKKHSTSHVLAIHFLKILLLILKNNHINQSYVADYFSSLLPHVREKKIAVLVVEEILKDNLHILQTKVRMKEISIFVNLLREDEMNVTFLQLIKSTCSCPRGVDSTQRMVVGILFGSDLPIETLESHDQIPLKKVLPSSHSLMLRLSMDHSVINPTVWADVHIYTSKAEINEIMGYHLVEKGLPRITVTWDTPGKFSIEALFGAKEVLLSDLFQSEDQEDQLNTFNNKQNVEVNQPTAKNSITEFQVPSLTRTNSKKLKVMSMKKPPHSKNMVIKRRVADYLVVQLYLVADLCLDRNYVAMRLLETSYPYDMLVTILKSECIHNRFKAPVCKILRCMYVDREPQVPVNYPRLVRLAKGEEEKQHTSLADYALLQHVISDYINLKLQRNRCDDLSVEMTDLLACIVKFGFYNDLSQILHISKPLIAILEYYKTDQTIQVDTFKVPSPAIHATFSMKFSDYLTFFKLLHVNWEFRYLEFTESIFGLCVTLSVVIVAVIMALIQTLQKHNHLNTQIFDIFVTTFFVSDITSRMYCYFIVKKRFLGFFRNLFNFLDLSLVILDFCMLASGFNGGIVNAGRLAKTFRIIRLLRLLRIVRAVRILKKIAVKSSLVSHWTQPERYSVVTEHESKTLVNILRILSMVSDQMMDYSLTIIVKSFLVWFEEIQNDNNVLPLDVYKRMIMQNKDSSTDFFDRLGPILLDIIMYHDPNMVEEALHLLMVCENRNKYLEFTSKDIQIIHSDILEFSFNEASKLLRDIKRMADMYEIWSELESEEDLQTARGLINSLNRLSALLLMKNEDCSLSAKQMFLVNREVQILFRNLGTMSTLMTVFEQLYNGGSEELNTIVVEILKSCSNLTCWFVKGNEENQKQAYENFDWFIDTVHEGFHTSQVTREILLGNRELIKQCSRRYIGDFVSKILQYGPKPEYLDLFVGMINLSFDLDSRVQPVEAEISKYLTGREWSDHLLKWCVGPNHPDYELRVEAMASYFSLETSYLTTYATNYNREENMSQELRYHLNLLIILGSCNLGPKLQALYPIDDIICAILDPRTVDPIRMALGRVFLECLKVDQDLLSFSEYSWKFVDHYISCLDEDSQLLNSLDSKSNKLSILIKIGSWHEISVSILFYLFSRFDLNQLGIQFEEDEIDDHNLYITRRTNQQVLMTIHVLYKRSTEFTTKHLDLFGTNLLDLFKKLNQVLILQQDSKAFEELLENSQLRTQSLYLGNGGQKRREETLLKFIIDDQNQFNVRERYQFFIDSLGLSSFGIIDTPKINNKSISESFPIKNPSITQTGNTNNNRIINRAAILLSMIPAINTPNVHSDIRFEPLIKKLASHMRSRLKRTKTLRSLSTHSAETTLWLLSTLREFLELKMNICVDFNQEINIDNYLDFNKAENFRLIFNDWGVTYLCMDLISVGIQNEITIEAIKLLIVLLIKPGGSLHVQQTIFQYLKETDSVLFFDYFKEAIDGILIWIQRELEVQSVMISDTSFPIYTLLTFIQLMCEGNYMLNKNIFREQTGNSRIVDVIECLVQFLEFLSRSESLICVHISSKILRTLQKLMQGPCKLNQEKLVLNTELLIYLNRLIRRISLKISGHEWEDPISLLKDRIVKVLLSATEGHTITSVVFERVASTVDFNVLNSVILPSDSENLDLSSINNLNLSSNLGIDAAPVISEYLVLLRTLGDMVVVNVPLPVIAKDMIQQELASVEVVWEGKVHQFFFKIPDLMKDLSKGTIRTLTESIDCESQEMKLKDIMKKAKRIFEEAQHQKYLRSFGINSFGQAKSFLSIAMFLNAILINILLMVFLGTRRQEDSHPSPSLPHLTHDDVIASSPVSQHSSPHPPTSAPTTGLVSSLSSSLFSHQVPIQSEPLQDMVYIESTVNQVIMYLTILQVVLSTIMVLAYILGRMPVIFSSYLEDNWTRHSSLFYTCLDKNFLWYSAYLILAISALNYERILVTAMLLEWISLSPTTQDVLLSVQYPARQLLGTLILILIVINVYSGVVFYSYRDDVITFDLLNLWESFKMSVSYGIRGEFGISHELVDTLGSRLIMDVSFFVVVVAVLRHILFAIIVDTFGELRKQAFEREMQANNLCFICGIDRHDFDRLALSGISHGLAFSHHRQITHNIFNYHSFIIHIWCNEESEDSGVEHFVRKCLPVGDISWFPLGISSLVNGLGGEGGPEKTPDKGEVFEGDEEVDQRSGKVLSRKDSNGDMRRIKHQGSNLGQGGGGDGDIGEEGGERATPSWDSEDLRSQILRIQHQMKLLSQGRKGGNNTPIRAARKTIYFSQKAVKEDESDRHGKLELRESTPILPPHTHPQLDALKITSSLSLLHETLSQLGLSLTELNSRLEQLEDLEIGKEMEEDGAERDGIRHILQGLHGMGRKLDQILAPFNNKEGEGGGSHTQTPSLDIQEISSSISLLQETLSHVRSAISKINTRLEQIEDEIEREKEEGEEKQRNLQIEWLGSMYKATHHKDTYEGREQTQPPISSSHSRRSSLTTTLNSSTAFSEVEVVVDEEGRGRREKEREKDEGKVDLILLTSQNDDHNHVLPFHSDVTTASDSILPKSLTVQIDYPSSPSSSIHQIDVASSPSTQDNTENLPLNLHLNLHLEEMEDFILHEKKIKSDS